MFAGIIEAVGEVTHLGNAPRRAASGTDAYVLEVDGRGLFDELAPGASVAVNGACLTLSARRGSVASFDVVPETWGNTNLRQLRSGDPVNLERALRVGDRIDGHFVQGHVDGVGSVTRIDRAAGQWKLWVSALVEITPYVVRKGSIALDGTSLTVVDVTGRSFSVALIPTTLERTVLGRRRPGDLLNIETDILARIVISRLGPSAAADHITWETLRQGGYS